MLPVIRTSTVIFSLCLHSGLVGGLYFFSGTPSIEEDAVYHVSLAEFAPVIPSMPMEQDAPPQQVATPPKLEPAPEPLPVHPPKIPPSSPPKKTETKKISPHKRKTERPQKIQPQPSPAIPIPPRPSSPVTHGEATQASGPVPRQIGGLMAFKTDQVDQRPSIAKRVAPEYPKQAKRMNIQGKVLVQVVIDTSGIPKNFTILEASPQGYFEENSLKAAKRMKFIPGKIKGKPVNTIVVIPFIFNLK